MTYEGADGRQYVVVVAGGHGSLGTVAILTWGGLRGGISVALALSLPDIPEKPALLAATYAVAVFSILVQGSTLASVVQRAKADAAAAEA